MMSERTRLLPSTFSEKKISFSFFFHNTLKQYFIRYLMTIGCTRCGATCEGDIIVPALAFKFKHNIGCGHGVGPLSVLPTNAKNVKMPDEPIKEPQLVDGKSDDVIVTDEAPKKVRAKATKTKVFGQNEGDN